MSALETAVTVVQSSELSALEARWTGLSDEAHPGAVFRSYPWLSSWWNNFSTGREATILLVIEKDVLLGILPLYSEPIGLGARRLRLMGDGIVGSDYLGVLARPGETPRVAAACAEWLSRSAYDEIRLDDLLSDDPLSVSLRQHLSQGGLSSRYRCPYVTVEGSFDEYLNQRPYGLAAQWHRRRRWLERCAQLRLAHLREPSEIEEGLSVLLELHQRRWAIEGGSQAIDGPEVSEFHRQAARRLAERGWAHLFVLYAAGQPRAALYGFELCGRFVYYQSGHDPEWRPRSVGTVLLGMVLRYCFEKQLKEFDFLHGEESYKWKWASAWRQTEGWRWRGSGVRAWLLDRRHRSAARMRHWLPMISPQLRNWLGRRS